MARAPKIYFASPVERRATLEREEQLIKFIQMCGALVVTNVINDRDAPYYNPDPGHWERELEEMIADMRACDHVIVYSREGAHPHGTVYLTTRASMAERSISIISESYRLSDPPQTPDTVQPGTTEGFIFQRVKALSNELESAQDPQPEN